MSKSFRVICLVHVIAAVILGLLFLVIPGRFLDLFRWRPIDPIVSRLLGAAFLALAWGSYRSWRATEKAQVAILVELQAVFYVLASAALLRHLVVSVWPWYVWVLFVGFVAFAIAWIYALVTIRR